MLVEFLEWWAGQLRELLPQRLLTSPGAQDALVADVSVPDTLTLWRRRRGTEQRLLQVRGDVAGAPGVQAALANRAGGEALLLRVPPGWLLERAVSLPLPAERELARVLGYEMERLTPFTAAELVWGYAVLQRDRVRARLGLRLTMVPRATLAPWLDALTRLGGAPQAVEAALPDGVRLLRLASAQEAGRTMLSARSLAVVVGVLAVLVLVSPALRQSLELQELQDRLDGMAPRIAQVADLRRRIAGSTAGGDAVAAETRRLGDTLEALAAITEVLPDDSYLTEFTMRERKMTMAGLAGSAPRLISGLSADARVRNPAFTAPVTKSETNHLDVFAIRAELAP